MASKRDVVLLNTKGNYKTSLLSSIVKQRHPFLVVDTPSPSTIQIVPLSSNMKQVSTKRPYNVVVNNWKSAGLQKPSYADVSTTGVVLSSEITQTIGQLSILDNAAVMNALSNTKQRRVIETYKIYNTGAPEYLDYYYDDNNNIKYYL